MNPDPAKLMTPKGPRSPFSARRCQRWQRLVDARVWAIPLLAIAAMLLSCEVGGGRITVPPLALGDAGHVAGGFRCTSEDTVACRAGAHYSCERVGEFLQAVVVDCAAQGLACTADRGCSVCVPDKKHCDGDRVVRCLPGGDGFEELELCDAADGYVCETGMCMKMCTVAQRNRSYVGCEFYAADLDNATVNDLDDASQQQYAVVVSNLHEVTIEVWVEVNRAPLGDPIDVQEVARVLVPPHDLEVFELPRREVDGSTTEGHDDGTHTAVTSNAYRVTSSHPIIAYQFNPLDNVDVFSNEASLLLPTSAIGTEYTVVGWPQTIGHSDDPSKDFDGTTADEDLRAFLTIIGTREDTHVQIELGEDVVQVVGGGAIAGGGPLDKSELDIGPFDVINLETQGFMADFTGTVVTASQPVSLFVGSEASDVPVFEDYERRQCCADHLEEQLFPNRALGTRFILARMPPRTTALNAAFVDSNDSVAEVDEPEWVRVVAVEEGSTAIETTLPPPDNLFALEQNRAKTLRAAQDFTLTADRRVAVLQALPSQMVVGIPSSLPGGDPAIVAVPPVQQYRDSYIFLTPDKYAFDFITVAAERSAEILLDGAPLPDHCTTAPADGVERQWDEPEYDWVIHRCQLSFPEVTVLPRPIIAEGRQSDGVHTVEADRPVGLVVYGFDRFVSYAYAGGLNLEPLD